MKNTTTYQKKDSFSSDSHPQFHHLYDLLEATCPPGYLAHQAQIQHSNKYRLKLQPEITEIIPGLFLGNQDAAIDAGTLQKHNITAICSCGHYLESPFEAVDYKRFLIGDFEQQDIRQYFEEFNNWVDSKLENEKHVSQENGRGNVLVHCSAGVSRSASFIIAYLIGRKGMSYESAFTLVKKCRNQINPNPGFISQLKLYEQQKISDNEG